MCSVTWISERRMFWCPLRGSAFGRRNYRRPAANLMSGFRRRRLFHCDRVLRHSESSECHFAEGFSRSRSLKVRVRPGVHKGLLRDFAAHRANCSQKQSAASPDTDGHRRARRENRIRIPVGGIGADSMLPARRCRKWRGRQSGVLHSVGCKDGPTQEGCDTDRFEEAAYEVPVV